MESEMEKAGSDQCNEREKVGQRKSVKRLRVPKKSQEYKRSEMDVNIEDIFTNSKFFKYYSEKMSKLSFSSGDNGEDQLAVDSKLEGPFSQKTLRLPSPKGSVTEALAEKDKSCRHSPGRTENRSCPAKGNPQGKTDKFLEEMGKEKIDGDLVPLITEQMFLAERELQTTRTHLMETLSKLNERDLEIVQLQEKIRNLQKPEAPAERILNTETKELSGRTPEDYQRITAASEKLKKQIKDMEDFLNDYGLMWVGGRDDNLKPDFDNILKGFQRLNAIASQPKIIQTTSGARFKVPREIPIALYSNGFLFRGIEFREYSKISTNLFLQDIEDGYFPGELQTEFPDGVPFEVFDKRNEVFKRNSKALVFQGNGNRLGSIFEDRRGSVVDSGPATQARARHSDSLSGNKCFDKSQLQTLQKKRCRGGSSQDDDANYLSTQVNPITENLEASRSTHELKDKTLKVKIRFGKEKTESFVMEVEEKKRMVAFRDSLQRELRARHRDECPPEPHPGDPDFELHCYGKPPIMLSDNLSRFPEECGILDHCVVNVAEV